RQPAELPEVGAGPLERPTGPGQAQQPLGERADEPGHAESVVERVPAGVAPRADQVQAVQADDPGGGQDVAGGVPLRPRRLAAARARAARRPLFSAAGACRWRAASTAMRASSLAAGTAAPSTADRTRPSGAASAACWTWRARSRACSTTKASSGVSAVNVRGMADPPGVPPHYPNPTQPPQSITAPVSDRRTRRAPAGQSRVDRPGEPQAPARGCLRGNPVARAPGSPRYTTTEV